MPKSEDDTSSITDDVREAEYYHGLLPKEDIEPLLKEEGDYILRKTERHGEIILALSTRSNGQILHFIVNRDDKGFYFEKYRRATVSDLVAYHLLNQFPISKKSKAVIKKAIDRPEWLLNHDDIKLAKRLGQGAFGNVYEAEMSTAKGTDRVAVKTMRGEVDREGRKNFMKEARLMRNFDHPHIVRMIGVAVHEHPLMIVIELCPGGSLLDALRNTKQTVKAKLQWTKEAADGLTYLERQNCVHRDIAARNCLLSGPTKTTLKISDFGLAEERSKLNEAMGRVPIKWLAPETLEKRVYSPKTDIWSFGVLVFEIYSDGAEPYQGQSNVDSRQNIIRGRLVDMPKGTPDGIKKIVAQCWKRDPAERPTFEAISNAMKKQK